MSHPPQPAPRQFPGVMVSSTFTDLREHRLALIKAIKGQGLTDLAMENDSAKPHGDVIDSSLQMVRDAAGYVGVISFKYGQVPVCAERNPRGLSITELEFDEALRLNRPVLLFIMGDEHTLRPAEVERDAGKLALLNAFRERAKQSASGVNRVYAVFDSLEDFRAKAIQSVAELRRHLDDAARPAPPPAAAPVALPGAASLPPGLQPSQTATPRPPELCAEPPYIGSHQFVGRRAQLDELNDWAAAAEQHPVLLYEAIGGSGKSMLTWHWLNSAGRVPGVRADWAGRFWYSFYERGAVMADFCRRALAYMTGQPLQELNKLRTPQLAEQLLTQLRARPWLLVLDGLERVLVAYHRADAAQLSDEAADRPTDLIASRDPCAAIRPEDDELLRALAAATPSKLLVTTRLVPKVLLNSANQAIPGVLRKPLPGLRPEDAEALLRACGVHGDSAAIRAYLQTHCDCHPLVTGVLAGLVQNHLPARGDFDHWAADAEAGGKLNLANLDLVQKRNHILQAALAALPVHGRQLLSTLALLSEAVDYEALQALNPHLPPQPQEVEVPADPAQGYFWKHKSDEDKAGALAAYQARLGLRDAYVEALAVWQRSPEVLSAPQKLSDTVLDLERRGLLQYDTAARRHDLHPVVRGVAAGALQPEETQRYGQRVVDHFSVRAHNPYEQAQTLDDVRDGLQVVRTLLSMGRWQQAWTAYTGDLGNAMAFNLEANAEVLALLRPLFTGGWAWPRDELEASSQSMLLTRIALALENNGASKEAMAAYEAAIRIDLESADWDGLHVDLSNVASCLPFAKAFELENKALRLAELLEDDEDIFGARLDAFVCAVRMGRLADADALWRRLDPMGRDWLRSSYRPGSAEYHYAKFQFVQGLLTEEQLAHAEKLAVAGHNRGVIRLLHQLRGEWRLAQQAWALAAQSFQEAVRMAREIGRPNAESEVLLVLAQVHQGQAPQARQEAERWAQHPEAPHQALAELWLALGDAGQAGTHALAAYRDAWADGEPYVYRHALNRAQALLAQLGLPMPVLPAYDPAKATQRPWEAEVDAAIERLRAEKEAEKEAAQEPQDDREPDDPPG